MDSCLSSHRLAASIGGVNSGTLVADTLRMIGQRARQGPDPLSRRVGVAAGRRAVDRWVDSRGRSSDS